MSLLLLSNDEKLNAATNTGISAANSWTNNTQTPLVIKKNSEIALQSLKVNRTANTVVTDQDNKLWMYIGKGRGDTAPLLERIEDPRTTCFTALLPRDDYSAQSFVDDCLIPSIKKGCYHPDYIDRVSGTVKESTVGQFEGYNIVFGEGNTAPADVFPADSEFIPATTHHDGEITDDFTWSNNLSISNLMNIAEKTADSRSRLLDADFALESARLAKNQVLQQAGTSMLAQANQMNQLVMELLRG